MGSHQVFCLRWSNHQSNMLSVFDELLQTEALVDVTIACEGLSLKAHKVVLSACSPYFQNLFVQNPCKHPIVILKDIKYNELKSLVDFMYKGEVNVTKEQLSALLKTAETLKIKGLAEVTGSVNGQHEPPEGLSRLGFPSAGERMPLLLGNSATASQQGLLVSEESGSRSPLPLSLHGIPYLKSSNISGGGGSSSSTGRSSLRSPLPKRKKTRHRRRSSDGTGVTEGESISNVEVQGSPELIVAKVEVTDDYENVPADMGESDERGKLTISQGEDSNDESMDNLYTSQGPASNPAEDDYSAMDDPMSSLASSQAPLSLIQKLKTSGPSTSLAGSNQGGDHESTAHLEYGGGDVSGGESYAAAGTLSGTGYIPKRGQPRILNVDEEAMIVKYIMDMAAQGRPATRRSVLEYGNTLLRREDRVPTGSIHCNPEKGLSNDWWKEFKKRHPGLPVRIPASSAQQSQDVP